MLIKKNEPIIVGVSGGPDSMYLLNKLMNDGYTNLIVAHVDYHWRKDSTVDEKLVKKFCKEHNLELLIHSVDRSVYKTNIGNFENYARQIRYDFFENIGRKYNAKYCFIAHNLNDVVETYILQKGRKGLVQHYGLQEVTKYKDLTIVRPMLDMKKSEILLYDKKNKIPYAIDKTNFNTKYTRNAIRKSLDESALPTYMKEIAKANAENDKAKNEAAFYAKNNLTADQLKITKKVKDFSIEKIMWILIEYLSEIGETESFFNRSKNTLREIAKELKSSTKSYLQIQIGDHYLIKDYDSVYIVDEDWFSTYRIEVKSDKDIDKIKGLQEWVRLQQDITKDKRNYPYLVTNDWKYYKKFAKVKGKKANRYFIDKKIPYKTRYQSPVAINLNNNEIISMAK